MLEELKQRVFNENIALVKHGLIKLTWGNVSGFDKNTGLVVIKPSGVEYDKMTPYDMVVVDLEGNAVEGKYRPSSDTPTHIFLYKKFPSLGGIVHTHSTYATAFAQAGSGITAYGTTHADAFYGNIPCTRALTKEEINGEYEKNTGKVIAEIFDDETILSMPAVLIKNHGVFTWGQNPKKAVEAAVTVEEVAKIAWLTKQINAQAPMVEQHLLDKHYFRKHGKNAYYGQN